MTITELEKQLALAPFDLDLRRRYARALMEADRLDDALKQCDMILQQKPRSPDPLLLRIEIFYELDRMDEAKQTYAEWDRATEGSLRAANEWDKLFGGAKGAAPGTPAKKRVETGVSFADVVGMEELKEQLRLKIILPFQKPEIYAKFKKDAGGGVLLYGPPGCGKTMIAKAIASECKASFISVGISGVLSKWLGESEANLAAVFLEARATRPSILFFDELDALAISRSQSSGSGMRNVINEFLQQLDGFGADNQDILLLAATNMPWDVDVAMKRHGRFSRLIFLPPPDQEARTRMLEHKLQGIPCEKVDFAAVAARCEQFSGADIDGIVDYAKEKALTATIKTGIETPIKQDDLLEAAVKIVPATREWLTTMVNLCKYGGGGGAYADVEEYLRKHKLL